MYKSKIWLIDLLVMFKLKQNVLPDVHMFVLDIWSGRWYPTQRNS